MSGRDSSNSTRAISAEADVENPARIAAFGAAASLVGAAVAAALRVAEPYEHGIWLVAYLVLVGFAAQLLLARGQSAVAGRTPSRGLVRLQSGLWNLGVLAVPLGVLIDSRLAIVLGAISLLVALGSYARTLYAARRQGRAGSRAMQAAYVVLVAGMTASVFVGVALGWERPWL
jgi:hypothetical protein